MFVEQLIKYQSPHCSSSNYAVTVNMITTDYCPQSAKFIRLTIVHRRAIQWYLDASLVTKYYLHSCVSLPKGKARQSRYNWVFMLSHSRGENQGTEQIPRFRFTSCIVCSLICIWLGELILTHANFPISSQLWPFVSCHYL